MLIVAALLAIIFANLPATAPYYEGFLHIPVGVVFNEVSYTLSLSHLINDGLMAIFFFLVGLEIKRELLQGHLASRSKAMLPLFAAIGGMVLPALIYVYFNYDDEVALRGWAVPTATDIAFSLGVLALLGSRAPVSLKIFLTAVAVIDDLGAITIIALFYTAEIKMLMLLCAAGVLAGLVLLNKMNVQRLSLYLIGFLLLWVFMLQSGVHATLAGVFTALTVPLASGPSGGQGQPDQHSKQPMLIALEHGLHGPVVFIILPIFAFANAGVNLTGLSIELLSNDVSMGIILGLVVGKALGISLGSWVAVRAKISQLPEGETWQSIFGVACLCGIGFTVSLFIGTLGFSDPTIINQVKMGVLAGSTIAGVLGYTLLRLTTTKQH